MNVTVIYREGWNQFGGWEIMYTYSWILFMEAIQEAPTSNSSERGYLINFSEEQIIVSCSLNALIRN